MHQRRGLMHQGWGSVRRWASGWRRGYNPTRRKAMLVAWLLITTLLAWLSFPI